MTANKLPAEKKQQLGKSGKSTRACRKKKRKGSKQQAPASRCPNREWCGAPVTRAAGTPVSAIPAPAIPTSQPSGRRRFAAACVECGPRSNVPATAAVPLWSRTPERRKPRPQPKREPGADGRSAAVTRPGILRRLASMFYESLLLLAVLAVLLVSAAHSPGRLRPCRCRAHHSPGALLSSSC
jgi:hypothetical protein